MPWASHAGFVAFGLAAACLGCFGAWLSGHAHHLRLMPAHQFESLRESKKDEPTWVQNFATKCGKMEVDVEYQDETSGYGVQFDHISTPEMCCALCHGNPKCKSFTWVKDAGLEGCPSQCWLKGGTGKPLKKKGLVSGIPPPRPQLPEVPSGVDGPGGSLWCFSLIQPKGYEKGMLQWQWARRASIFACDGFGVYSNKKIEVAPGVTTSIVDSNLKCNFGGDSGTALNAWIFIAVWKQVIADAEYKKYDWVVKVDPDAVFFPDRLGRLLQGREKAGYINNCKYGMHGPLEVFSSKAIDILADDYNQSWDGKSPKRCVTKKHFGLWGEDMFLDQCFQKVLKVKPRPLEAMLMCEDHCDCPTWYWCQNDTKRVSYHPFKTTDSYEVCMARALGGTPDGPAPPASDRIAQLKAFIESSNKSSDDEAEDSEDDEASKATAAADSNRSCIDAVRDGRAVKGQAKCAKEVRWAKEHGLFEHKEWYKGTGLSADSPYADFQLYLHKKKKVGCPKPCSGKAAEDDSKTVGLEKKEKEEKDASDEKQEKDDESDAEETDAKETNEEESDENNDEAVEPSKETKSSANTEGEDKKKMPPPGPRAQTFYMYRAQGNADYPLENINTADLAGVMWYLHNEVVQNTPRKYHVDRIKRYKVTVQNTWEFWNAHKRQFSAFVAYDAGRCSTPICKDIYHHYGFVVGCQVCDTNVAAYLAKDQTNWNCEKGSDKCRAGIWYSLPGPCPAMGMSNNEINPNKDSLNVMKSKDPKCVKRMPGGHCKNATGAPDCTYSYEEAGEIMLNELVGIVDYNDFWNTSFTRCAHKAKKSGGHVSDCKHQKEYVRKLDTGIGCSFWDGIHGKDKCADRMNAVRRLFKKHYPAFPESLPEPPCEFDMYYNGEFKWKINHTGAEPSDWWDQRM